MNEYNIGDRVLMLNSPKSDTYSERAKDFLTDYDHIFTIRTISFGLNMEKLTFTMEETDSMIWHSHQVSKIMTKQKQIIPIEEDNEQTYDRFEILDL